MVRKFSVGSLDQIDYNNFGVHFSANNDYHHCGGGSNGVTKNTRFEVSFYADVAELNEAATAMSREEYPAEQECVLVFGQNITGELYILDTVENEILVDGTPQKVNTGTRADAWVFSV